MRYNSFSAVGGIMKSCTFFGHRHVFGDIEPVLREAVTALIENEHVGLFYVGSNGMFDSMVLGVLKELSGKYSFGYYMVLSYVPERSQNVSELYGENTLVPDGIETVPKRFAIIARNKWMINNSDIVITYVRHDQGSGAARFRDLAKKEGKTVIEI